MIDKVSAKQADRQPAGEPENGRRATNPQANRLTKADTVALWHAVDNYVYTVRAMPEVVLADGSKFTPEQIEAERERLAQAKRALRKVNAIRRAQR